MSAQALALLKRFEEEQRDIEAGIRNPRTAPRTLQVKQAPVGWDSESAMSDSSSVAPSRRRGREGTPGYRPSPGGVCPSREDVLSSLQPSAMARAARHGGGIQSHGEDTTDMSESDVLSVASRSEMAYAAVDDVPTLPAVSQKPPGGNIGDIRSDRTAVRAGTAQSILGGRYRAAVPRSGSGSGSRRTASSIFRF